MGHLETRLRFSLVRQSPLEIRVTSFPPRSLPFSFAFLLIEQRSGTPPSDKLIPRKCRRQRRGTPIGKWETVVSTSLWRFAPEIYLCSLCKLYRLLFQGKFRGEKFWMIFFLPLYIRCWFKILSHFVTLDNLDFTIGRDSCREQSDSIWRCNGKKLRKRLGDRTLEK